MNKLPTGIINIEGERDLVRDRNSKALLNTNNESLKAYKIKRNANLKIIEYENDINTLKTEIVEIRKTLEILVHSLSTFSSTSHPFFFNLALEPLIMLFIRIFITAKLK